MKPNKTHERELIERRGHRSAIPRVRVHVDHSPDCTDAARGDVLWVHESYQWRDVAGTCRGGNRRWMLFRCNGGSSEEHGDERRFCKARVIVEEFRLSDVINIVLNGGV